MLLECNSCQLENLAEYVTWAELLAIFFFLQPYQLCHFEAAGCILVAPSQTCA